MSAVNLSLPLRTSRLNVRLAAKRALYIWCSLKSKSLPRYYPKIDPPIRFMTKTGEQAEKVGKSVRVV